MDTTTVEPTDIGTIVRHLPAGSVIQACYGTLDKLYTAKRGQGEHGEYCFQSGELRDDSGAIQIVISGRELVPAMRGSSVWLRAGTNAKTGAPCGLLVIEEAYNGGKTKKLKITSSASILGEDGRVAPLVGQGAANQPMPVSAGARAMMGAKTAQEARAISGNRERPSNGNNDYRPHGATVGMAINNAVEALSRHYDADYLVSSDFARKVYLMASRLVLVAKRIEDGKLAPME